MKDHLSAIVRSLVGTRSARQAALLTGARAGNPLLGLEDMVRRVPSDNEESAPIFIFSAGWRSGSTLLQRLVCSDSSTLIWGEPYDLCGIVQALVNSCRPISNEWPPEDYFVANKTLNSLSDNWIANLYPSMEDLRASLRALLLNLFANPAEARGASRWGIKEVRFGLKEATFLHWLFPEAKFLMIHRPVEDAFSSYRQFSPSMRWYANWPEQPVFTPFAFARHRQRLLKEFPAIAAKTGGRIIPYDDLIRGRVDLVDVARYCDVTIDETVLKNKIGGHGEFPKQRQTGPGWLDRTLLHAGTEYERRRNHHTTISK